MSIKRCFLPCAGLGTRMGEVGKKLPKPLWPLFETTLVGAQIEYAKTLGIDSFCINSHHQKDKISSWVENQKNKIVQFNEPTLLGSGGCFHNIKKTEGGYDGLFIFNPDSFLLMHESDWRDFLEKAEKEDQLLIAIPCQKNAPYNRLVIEGNQLKEIVPPNEDAPAVTYSGFGKISLKSLKHSEGVSGFFETVAIPGRDGPYVFTPKEKFEFWDFGTINSYLSNVNRVLIGEQTKLRDFLIRKNLINLSLIGGDTYNSSEKGVVNFTAEDLDSHEPGVYLKVNDEQLLIRD